MHGKADGPEQGTLPPTSYKPYLFFGPDTYNVGLSLYAGSVCTGRIKEGTDHCSCAVV
jgi:hypothetical protein